MSIPRRAARLAGCLGAALWLGSAGARVVCTVPGGGVHVFSTAPGTQVADFKCQAEAPTEAERDKRSARAMVSSGNAVSQAREPALLPMSQRRQGGQGSLRLLEGGRVRPDSSKTHAMLLDPMIANAARRHGHDANLLKAIIHVESRFNPNALSSKGAIGLMQVMPATGLRMGVREPDAKLFDPATNLDAGARYLRILMDMFNGQAELAIAAYNAGEGAVLRHGGKIPPYPETVSYVRDVMAQYGRYRGL